MSGAADKYAGALIGARRAFYAGGGNEEEDESAAVAQSASIEEVLVLGGASAAGPGPGAPARLLVSSLDAATGEIVWRAPAGRAGGSSGCGDDPHDGGAAARTLASVVCRSQMASMLRDAARNEAYDAAISAVVGRSKARARLAAAAEGGGERGGAGGPSAAAPAAAGPADAGPAVLDIGAGAGLLSLLAARAGASRVDGIEQWAPMAAIARSVVAANAAVVGGRGAVDGDGGDGGMGGGGGGECTVRIHTAHSTDMRVAEAAAPLAGPRRLPSPPLTIPRRADVVVSEILDSGLLGEGVLPALRDAFARLAVLPSATAPAGPLVVPVRATVYAQLVRSEAAGRWQDTARAQLRPAAAGRGGRVPSSSPSSSHSYAPHSTPPLLPSIPLSFSVAPPAGCEALHPAIPVHASRLFARGDITALTAPFAALDIDFTASSPLLRPAGSFPEGEKTGENEGDGRPAGGIVERELRVEASPAALGEPANAVLWWWEAVLDEGDATRGVPPTTYSTSPAAVEQAGWQDHWTQCLQPLPRPVAPSAAASSSPSPSPSSSCFTVVASHNDFRIWFYAGPGNARVWPSKRTHKLAEKKAKAAAAVAAEGGGVVGAAGVVASAAGALAEFALPPLYTEPQPCMCGLHACASVDRRWALSDPERSSTLAAGADAAIALALARKRKAEAEMQALAREMGVEAAAPAEGGGGDAAAAAAADTVRVLDISDGGVCALLAASSPSLLARNVSAEGGGGGGGGGKEGDGESGTAAAGARCVVFVPLSVPTTTSAAEPVAAGERTSAGDEQQPASTSSSSSSSSGPVDTARVHLAAAAARAEADGWIKGPGPAGRLGSAVVLVAAPPHACTPDILGAAEAAAFKVEDEDEDDDDEDDDDEDEEPEEEEEEEEEAASAPAPAPPVSADVVLGEPFFQHMATVPLWAAAAWWRRLYAAVDAGSVSGGSSRSGSSAAVISPRSCAVWALPVRFAHLHDSFAPVGRDILGLHHGPFDDVQRGYSAHSFQMPVWQYEYEGVDCSQGGGGGSGGGGAGGAVRLLDADFRQRPGPAPGLDEAGGGEASASAAAAALLGRSSSSSAAGGAGGGGGGGMPWAAGTADLTTAAANAVIFWVDFDMSPGILGAAAADEDVAEGDRVERLVVSTGPGRGGPGPFRQTVRFLTAAQAAALASPSASHCLRIGAYLDGGAGGTGAFETSADVVQVK